MHKTLRALAVFATIICFVGTLLIAGCTKHPNEEQMNTLEETKKAALSAEDELAKKQQEKADLENELAEKNEQLEKAKEEKAAIKSQLGDK